MPPDDNSKQNRFLKPSDKNGLDYILDHIEEVRKKLDRAFGETGIEPTALNPYQAIAALIYWRALTTFNCFKSLCFGGFTEESKTLLRTLLEADIRLQLIAQEPQRLATSYQAAAVGETERMVSMIKEIRNIVDVQTGATNPTVTEIIAKLEDAHDLSGDESQAYRYWKGMSFKAMCIETGRSYEYILYSICSQAIHAAPSNLASGIAVDNQYFRWILLGAACRSYLSIAATVCHAFAIPEIPGHIDELRWWLNTCDEDWRNAEMQKLLEEN